MKKYLILYYQWWMDSGYFEREVIEAASLEDAQRVADANCHRRQSTFHNYTAYVLECTQDEVAIVPPKGYRLSFWQRITGRV